MLETDVSPGPTGSDGSRPGLSRSGTAGIIDHPAERRPVLRTVSIVVLTLGLAVTATLALTARSLHDSNEDRLLHQRVSEAGAVLSAAIPNLQTPLASGAVLAEATDGEAKEFTSLMTPLVTGDRPRFVSVSVWSAAAPAAPRPLVVVGVPPELAEQSGAEIRTFLERAAGKPTVSVLDLLGPPDRRLGYGTSAGPRARYVVYGEASLPENRRAQVDTNSAFADLDYAIYLGGATDSAHLLATSGTGTQLTGRTDHADVPFGDSKLRIVMSPRGQLGGDLLARLPWLIGAGGLAIAVAAALMTERLVRRRTHAELLAQQNARLFSEQRSVAQTLQHSLLPEALPEFPGLDLAVRYVPGVDGVDIGGDWYDVIGVGDGRVVFVVGDVSGRGLRAATVMASLRYAIRAYVAQGDAPATVLSKLTKLVSIVRDGHFATVLCGIVDVAAHTATFANAGHPNPLVIDGDAAEFVTTRVGPPVGVKTTAYESVTVTIPPRATLLAYTDGLFERRSENPDTGLARLRTAATGDQSLDGLLDGLLRFMTPDGGHDDTAILGMRWRS